MSDKECDNYYRLITLVVRTGAKTLREVFKKHTTGDIASVLKSHRSKFGELNRNRVLTDPQYQHVIADNPDLDKFDISLLVTLIRSICTSVDTPPGNGWKTVTVQSSDTSVGGYIIRIRNVRNEIVGHSSDTRVSNDLFKYYWAEAENSLKKLAAHVDIFDEIAEEIKTTEGTPLTTDSNTNFEATLKKWRVEELYTELVQLNEKADGHANDLQTLMNDVSFIRKQIEGGQHTGHSGSANQQTEPDVNNIMLLVNKEMNQTRNVLEIKYDSFCKLLGMNAPQQQQTEALPPIVNPNALTEEEIVKYSKQLGRDWEIFAINLGYKQDQIDQLCETYPKQIQTMLRTILQKWHDVVARCENENPKKLLAASFASIGDNSTAIDVLSKDVKKMKPSPETKKKIEKIDFDLPSSTQTMQVVHFLGGFVRKTLEQQPGSKSPDIDGVE